MVGYATALSNMVFKEQSAAFLFFEGVSVLSKLFAAAGVSILDGPIWHHNYYSGSVLGFRGSVWYIIKKRNVKYSMLVRRHLLLLLLLWYTTKSKFPLIVLGLAVTLWHHQGSWTTYQLPQKPGIWAANIHYFSGRGHPFMAFTKNDQFFYPLLSTKINNRYLVPKQYNPQTCQKLQDPIPTLFCMEKHLKCIFPNAEVPYVTSFLVTGVKFYDIANNCLIVTHSSYK